MQIFFLTEFSVNYFIGFVYALMVALFVFRLPTNRQGTRNYKNQFGLALLFSALLNLLMVVRGSLFFPEAGAFILPIVLLALVFISLLVHFYLYFPQPVPVLFRRVTQLLLVAGFVTLMALYYGNIPDWKFGYEPGSQSYVLANDFVLTWVNYWVGGLTLVLLGLAFYRWRTGGEHGSRTATMIAVTALTVLGPNLSLYLATQGHVDMLYFHLTFITVNTGGMLVVAFLFGRLARASFSLFAQLTAVTVFLLLVVVQLFNLYYVHGLNRQWARQMNDRLETRLAGQENMAGEGRVREWSSGGWPGGRGISLPPALNNTYYLTWLYHVLEKSVSTGAVEKAGPADQEAEDFLATLLEIQQRVFEPAAGWGFPAGLLWSELAARQLIDQAGFPGQRDALGTWRKINQLHRFLRQKYALSDHRRRDDWRKDYIRRLEAELGSPLSGGLKNALKRVRDWSLFLQPVLPLRESRVLNIGLEVPVIVWSRLALLKSATGGPVQPVLLVERQSLYHYREFIHSHLFPLFMGTLLFLSLVLVIYYFLVRKIIHQPLRRLYHGLELIEAGRLDDGFRQLNTGLTLEFELVTDSFNRMTDVLKEKEESVRKTSEGLENLVRQKTASLRDSIGTLQKLKDRQDADYFLTSQVAQPFQQNNNHGRRVRTEFRIEQFKKFRFQKLEYEIGGDICLTETIFIAGQQYTFFLNGDAMGKSLLGAGGTLVLGASIKAQLIRARLGKALQRRPELWLRDIYRDLQDLFRPFEGGMYITAVIGLAHEQTGFIYYVNAEHPGVVLLNNRGRAVLLDSPRNMPKLGGKPPGLIHIKTVQLKPGETLVTGSDGRDDVLLGRENGQMTVNEDENLFLSCLETARGDLDRTIRELKSKGQLIDDLSLLTVRFEGAGVEDEGGVASAILPGAIPETTGGDAMETQPGEGDRPGRIMDLIGRGRYRSAMALSQRWIEEYPEQPGGYEMMARALTGAGELQDAIPYWERDLELAPGNEEGLHELARIYFLEGRYSEAADFGESLYLRNNQHTANNILLAEIYNTIGVRQRARGILSHVPGDQVPARLADLTE